LADGLLTASNLKMISFKLNGLDAYLKKVAAAGNNIDEACKLAVAESAKPIFEDIKIWVEKHKGNTEAEVKSVRMTPAKQDGNYIGVEVGIDSNIVYTSWHAVFDEFGTPTQPADPGIRNAFYHNKGRVRKIQKQIFEEKGVPID